MARKIGIALTFTLCALSITAQAAFDIAIRNASTRASLQFDAPITPNPSVTNTDAIISPLDTLAFSEFDVNVGGVFSARAAGFQSTLGINAAFAEVSTYFPEIPTDFAARASTDYWIEVSSSDNLAAQQIPFKFVINSGELRIDDFTRFDPFIPQFDGAAVAAEIRVDGMDWRFGARLTKDPISGLPLILDGPNGPNLDEFGLGIFPNLSVVMDGTSAVVSIPRIEGEVLIDGSEFNSLTGVFIRYSMAASFEMLTGDEHTHTTGLAGITDPFALGTPGDPSDDLGGNFSPAGVEFFLDGVPLAGAVSVVPLPGSALLLLPALAVVARLSHRAG